MPCFVDLVRLRVFPDAKDISESFGALQAVIRHGMLADVSGSGAETGRGAGVVEQQMAAVQQRRGVLCISIGDGSSPRTACLAAHITSWHTVSVHPALRQEWVG
jgi:hypothetical protein